MAPRSLPRESKYGGKQGGWGTCTHPHCQETAQDTIDISQVADEVCQVDPSLRAHYRTILKEVGWDNAAHPLLTGLDHLDVLVRDLTDAAAVEYEKMI